MLCVIYVTKKYITKKLFNYLPILFQDFCKCTLIDTPSVPHSLIEKQFL